MDQLIIMPIMLQILEVFMGAACTSLNIKARGTKLKALDERESYI